MSGKSFKRESRGSEPVLAICYDFDKTLTPDDMQAQGYIQAVGKNVKDFWTISNGLAEENDMDQNLAYMYCMARMAEGRLVFTRDVLASYGARVKLFSGVDSWFERMRRYGAEHHVQVEHYIISSGLKEMIEGTAAARAGAFKKIYASSFFYNEKGVAVWPAQVVNYTNKTQFLFRIEKGVLDVNDPSVNEYFPPETVRVPFRNMIYIGDSATDIPCMKLVTARGGYSIGVYNAEDRDKSKVYQMMQDGRIRYFEPADYREGSSLDTLVKSIIFRTAANEVLERASYQCRTECEAAAERSGKAQKQKNDWLIALENSGNFARTHFLIQHRPDGEDWTEAERERLLAIALANSQVRYILTDADVRRFYETVLQGMEKETTAAAQIREALGS